MKRLNGRVAVVTDGYSGIGPAPANCLADDKPSVAVVAVKDAAEARSRSEAAGGKSSVAESDVTNPGYVREFAKSVALSRGLANELGRDGITVNAMAATLVRNAATEASELASMLDTIPSMQAILRPRVRQDLVGRFRDGQTTSAVDGGLTKG